MSVSRVVIVNLTRFGDLLQTSPTVAALHKRYPGTAVTMVAEKNFADVCEGIPGIDRIYRLDLDRLGALLLKGGPALLESYRYVEEVLGELRRERFELALNFSSSRMSAVFMGLLGVPDTRGWTMTENGMRVIRHPWARLFATMCLHRRVATFNLVDYYRAIAGADEPSGGLAYEVAPAAQTAADALLGEGLRAGARPLVALQLGASRASRQWPSEAFIDLGRRLTQGGCDILLVGGGAERLLARRVAAGIGGRVVNACGRTGIGELGGLLKRAAVLISGDTGPMHMAAAVGTPVVALFFGPASPFDTGPYGTDHLLLHTGAPCAPCNHTVTCLNPFCRDDITPEIVEKAVRCRLIADWDGVERMARETPGIRVYRTGFDAHGWYACEPVGDPVPRPEDELRRAYRATLMAELLRVPVPSPRAGGMATTGFVALGALAAQGAGTAATLGAAARSRNVAIDDIERLGRELETLDHAVVEHGWTHPETTILTQLFQFGKENLRGDDVPTLAGEMESLYRTLASEAQLMAGLLGTSIEKERQYDAYLHQ